MGSLAHRLAEETREIRILTIDIETRPMKVYSWGLFNQFHSIDQIIDHGGLLCFAAKWVGQKDVLFFSEWDDGLDAMVKAAHDLLSEADVVISYNGDRFDVKKLNNEFMLRKMPPPRPFKSIDLIKSNKARFDLPSRKLDYLVQRAGLGRKTPHTGFQLWIDCMEGDAKAHALMRKYNEQDVKITEKAYLRLLPWLTNAPHLGMFLRDESFVCPYCAAKIGSDLAGLAHTLVQSYDLFQCRRCEGWSRGLHRKQDPTRTRALR
jgi:DNA polymerase elongation subunit (family B)